MTTIDRQMFFDRVVPIFGGTPTPAQHDGCVADIVAWEKAPRGNLDAFAYVLATDKWESWHTMQPIREGRASSDAQALRILAGVWYAKIDPVTGWAYYGRGKPQLTHKRNYATMTKEVAGPQFNVDLVTSPEEMLRMDIAVQVMMTGMAKGLFTGAGLPLYFKDDGAPRNVAARAIVNGTDHAGDIADLALKFRYALGGTKRKGLLQFGMMDDPEVEALQSALKNLGYPIGVVDGDFGPATKAAVMAFQHDRGLDADGVAGPMTRDLLNV